MFLAQIFNEMAGHTSGSIESGRNLEFRQDTDDNSPAHHEEHCGIVNRQQLIHVNTWDTKVPFTWGTVYLIMQCLAKNAQIRQFIVKSE